MLINISKTIQLKPIAIENQAELVVLMQQIYPPVYKHLWKNGDCDFYINKFYNPEQLQKELSNKDAEYHFVIFNLKIVGIVRIQYNYPLLSRPNKISTYINRIYLAKKAQGKGVARRIFNWIELHAKKHKSDLLWLKVMDTQEQAIKFYKKQGFKINGTTHLDFNLLHKPLRGMYIMTKTL